MNQQLFEKNFCNQSGLYEGYGRIPLRVEAITCLATLSVVSKDELGHEGRHW